MIVPDERPVFNTFIGFDGQIVRSIDLDEKMGLGWLAKGGGENPKIKKYPCQPTPICALSLCPYSMKPAEDNSKGVEYCWDFEENKMLRIEALPENKK